MLPYCARNGCENDANWRVPRKLDGDIYAIPVCDKHHGKLLRNQDP